MNILVATPFLSEVMDGYKARSPGLYATDNFEQVLGLAREGKVDRLCIIHGADFHSTENYLGQALAERLHEEFPEIPVMIWDGRIAELTEDEGYKWTKLTTKNETYLRIRDYRNSYEELIQKFFSGILLEADLPMRSTKSFDNAYGERPKDGFFWMANKIRDRERNWRP